jgi:uncharacterized protein YjbI with pentapeptide repeats
MAKQKHLDLFDDSSVEEWNKWKQGHPRLRIDLSEVDLNGADLSGANLSGADLSGANLYEANRSCDVGRGLYYREIDLSGVNLRGADLGSAILKNSNLSGADLSGADLKRADFSHMKKLSGIDLREANLSWTDLSYSNLNKANLSGAQLYGTQLVGTNLCHADLRKSRVYGISAWDLKTNRQTRQENLIITPDGEPDILVDKIKVAQFIYLLLDNEEIRDVIDTITSKAVLILGRFSEERKPVLDAIRDELRKPEHNYLPIVFDFKPLTNQTTIETIKTLANMARFVIADLTDARSVLMELQAIVPGLPSVAVRLLIKKSAHEYGMLDFIRAYRSVVKSTYEYESLEDVVASIKENVIGPAEEKVKELRQAN